MVLGGGWELLWLLWVYVSKCDKDVIILGGGPYSKAVDWSLACLVWAMPSTYVDRWTDMPSGQMEPQKIFLGATWLRADAVLQNSEIDGPRQRRKESRARSSEEDSQWTWMRRAPQSIWLGEETWRLEGRDLGGVTLHSSSVSSFHKYLWNTWDSVLDSRDKSGELAGHLCPHEA